MGRVWRFCATVSSYVVYGVGSLLLWSLIYPATAWAVPRHGRQHYARRLSRRAFRFFVAWMRWTGVWRYRIEGERRLQGGGCLIVANHPSFLDVVLLFAFVDNAVCVVKPALARIPLVGRPIRLCGHIQADDPQVLIQAACHCLAEGANLILFPQGTRTPPGTGFRFQRSAARIALEAGAPIVPVYLRYRPLLLGKNHPWYRIPSRRPQVHLMVGERVDPRAVAAGAPSLSLAARRLTRHLESMFVRWECDRICRSDDGPARPEEGAL